MPERLLSAQTAQAISGTLSGVPPIKSDSAPSAGKPAQKFSVDFAGGKTSGFAGAADKAGAAGAASSQGGENDAQTGGQSGSASGQHTQPGTLQTPVAAANGTAAGVAQASAIANHASAHASAAPLRGADSASDATRQTSQQAGTAAARADGDEPATHLVRRMLKAEYRRRFGDAAPPPLTLKFEKRRSVKRRVTRPNASTKGTA